MTGIAAVAIVMAIGEGGAPTTDGLVAAVTEAFVPGTAIRISEVPFPTDEAGLLWERELAARAVVTVHWEDAPRLRVRVRMHVANTDRWTDRVLRFAPDDTPVERGRTVGFAIASMWPDATLVRSSPPPGLSSDVSEPKARRDSPMPRRALSASFNMAAGIRGTAQGLGGSLDGALFLDPAFAVRVGVELRAGSVAEVPGTSLVGIAALGFEWWPVAASLATRLAFGLRGDFLLLRHQIIADSADDAVKGRFLPGAYLGPELGVRLGMSMELLFGAGVEVAFGNTYLRSGDPLARVATIPPFRATGHGGLRLRF